MHDGSLELQLHQHWKPLVAYANRLLGDVAAAEDVVQRAFIRVWERRYPMTQDSSLRALLYSVVKHLAWNELRHERVHARWVAAQPVSEPSETALDAIVEADDLQRAIDAAVSKLPARRREIFALSRFHHLSNAEIAQVLSISPQTVANQLVSALRTLREMLDDHIEARQYPPLKVVRNEKSQAG
jgi:RNA polymerase sigma-70 factor (ECF subfamily)